MIIGNYGKYKPGKYTSKEQSRKARFGKSNSENIVRNIHVEKLQFGKDKSKEYKSQNTEWEIQLGK